MGFRDHLCKCLVYILITRITHQSHYRKRQCSINLSVAYQCISALCTHHFFYSKSHIMVIISHYDNIVGIMRNTGSNRTAADSISFHNTDSHFSCVLMALNYSNLLEFAVRSEIFLTICFHPRNLFQHILRYNLLLKHLDYSRLCSRMFQFQAFLTET